MTKKSRQKLKYRENERSFWGEIKIIFYHFKGLTVVKNGLRPEGTPLINIVAILMVPAKMATLGLIKRKYFEIKIMTLWFLFKTSSTKFYHVTLMTKVWELYHFYERSCHNLNFVRIWPEKIFFDGCLWFTFNNLGLGVDITLEFYTSVVKA